MLPMSLGDEDLTVTRAEGGGRVGSLELLCSQSAARLSQC